MGADSTRYAVRAGAAFRLGDPELAGHVVLDFAAFDWWEEDEPQVSGAPRRRTHDGR